MFGAALILAASGFVADSANAQNSRTLRITNGFANAGQQAVVQVQVDSQGNETSIAFSFAYNQAVLTNPVVTLGNGVPAGADIGTNTASSAQGLIGVLVSSTNAYATGTRNVATITFTVAPGAQLGIYPVSLGNAPTNISMANTTGGLLTVVPVNGSVQVGSTAAGVEVSGRVVTPEGRGIRNAQVVITDTAGNRRVATTSSFGIYRFEDVAAGATYTVSVASKQFRFTPRVIQIVDNLSDFDFVGQQ